MDTFLLHDATLKEVRFVWAAGRCEMLLSTAKSPNAVLVFTDVSRVEMSREQPWGPSVSVNEIRECGNQYEVELQSGDIIRITAAGWSFINAASEFRP